MLAFFAHPLELLAAHIAELVFSTLGAAFCIWLWKHAKRFWTARGWLNRAVSVGVRNFFPSRESYSVDRSLAFSDYLGSAKYEFTYFGHWLAFSVEQHNTLETLIQQAKRGVLVRLVLLDPTLSPEVLAAYSRYFGEDAPKLGNEVADTWRRVKAAQLELGASDRKNFKLFAHSEFIPYSAFWFDPNHPGEHILIDTKLFGAPRRDAYGIELHPTKDKSSRYPSLFRRYAESLTRLKAQSEERRHGDA